MTPYFKSKLGGCYFLLLWIESNYFLWFFPHHLTKIFLSPCLVILSWPLSHDQYYMGRKISQDIVLSKIPSPILSLFFSSIEEKDQINPHLYGLHQIRELIISKSRPKVSQTQIKLGEPRHTLRLIEPVKRKVRMIRFME